MILWIIFFCYSTVCALLMQKVLLPLMPALHLGSGLMQNDSVLFHNYAISMADAISARGWSEWTIHPAPGYTGNVAVLAALYAMFRPDPSLMVPITAAAHAAGGVLIYLLGRNLWPGPVGKYGGIAAAALFIGFPSAMTWYGQPLKDTFSTAGILLVLCSWLLAMDRPPTLRTAATLSMGITGGIALIFFVRPYLLVLLFIAVLLMFFSILMMQLFRRTHRSWKCLVCFIPAMMLLAAGMFLGSEASKSVIDNANISVKVEGYHWVHSENIPRALDKYFAAAGNHRASFITLGKEVKAGSMIDADILPNSVSGVLAYLPRALQIALFTPFPEQWFGNTSVPWLVGIAETITWYLVIPGLIFALRAGRSAKMALLTVYALFFLTVLGFLNPNLGTLHRMRYAYLFPLMLVGILGWTHWLLGRKSAARQESPPVPALVQHASALANGGSPAIQTRLGVATTGLLVISLTLVANLGFFLRDLLMARKFGLGDELDAFFIAMMVPMFLVTVFSSPLGTAMTPAFLRARESRPANAAQDLVSSVSCAAALLLGVLALLLYLFTPVLLPYIGLGFDPAKLGRATVLMNWALPILIASSSVIIGNAVLNALQSFALPSWGQVAVPVIAIFALIAFGDVLGARAVIIGMFLGQLVNLAIVAWGLRQRGLKLRPRLRIDWGLMRDFALQYFPLVAAAFFINFAAPVGNIMASSLASGSVAALGLGSKIVLFVTGIVGTGIAAVILPHFSAYTARNRIPEVRDELAFFLVAGTLITIPVCLIFFLAAEPLTALVLAGSAASGSDTETVAQVFKFGIVQLPFFTCNILLLRFAVARHRSGRVMVVSFFSLAVNIALNLLLMRYMGVAGIALATTLATGVSASLMLVTLNRLDDVPFANAVVIAINWVMFLTLMLCLHYRNPVGVFMTGTGILLLVAAFWREAAPLRRGAGPAAPNGPRAT